VTWRTACSKKKPGWRVDQAPVTRQSNVDDAMKDPTNEAMGAKARTVPTEETYDPPKRRKLDAGIDPEHDPPMDAYRKCERAVRELLSQFLQGEPEINSVAAAVMTCAQDYALTMARFYRQARETHGDADAPSSD
jgi:hypothetical protein